MSKSDSSCAAADSLSSTPLFKTVFLGGFECASQRLAGGRRLDLLDATQHDELAAPDYIRLRNVGMSSCRDGVPWPLVERPTGFDFSRFVPKVRAARRHGVDVIWDLMRFGWPDGLDPFSGEFPSRFGRYAGAFARWISLESDRPPVVVPVSQMSLLASGGGDLQRMNPFGSARGTELKAQLVRASIEAIEAIRLVLPGTRFLQPEPLINVISPTGHAMRDRAASENLAQLQAWDMLAGHVWPSLGGHPRYLDIVGVDYFPDHQRLLDGTTVARDDRRYRPFSEMLLEIGQRYRRPMIVSATGSDGGDRAPWLRYVGEQCLIALRRGCDLHGITLYPILSHPGHPGHDVRDGLWEEADASGHRAPEPRLLAELLELTPLLEAARGAMLHEKNEVLAQEHAESHPPLIDRPEARGGFRLLHRRSGGAAQRLRRSSRLLAHGKRKNPSRLHRS